MALSFVGTVESCCVVIAGFFSCGEIGGGAEEIGFVASSLLLVVGQGRKESLCGLLAVG